MGVGARMLMTSTDHGQAGPADTGRLLDYYIEGEGFFGLVEIGSSHIPPYIRPMSLAAWPMTSSYIFVTPPTPGGCWTTTLRGRASSGWWIWPPGM